MDDKDKLYTCPICGFHYRDEATAKACEAWCREHKSCNIEITAHAVENDQSATNRVTPRMKLIFVYNADSGLLNALKDTAHKIVAPNTYACNLCRVTFGPLSMKDEWRAYVEALPHDIEFLHRDEFKERFPKQTDAKLPALFIVENEQTKLCLSADDINKVKGVHELIERVDAALKKTEL